MRGHPRALRSPPSLTLVALQHIASAGASHIPVPTRAQRAAMTDTNVVRVLRLFRLSAPPVFFLLACYVFLGEHVFGLAYVVGKRLKPRVRATLRACYRLSTRAIALVMHLYLLVRVRRATRRPLCPPHALRRAPLPRHHVGERALLRRHAARGAVGQPDVRPRPARRGARARVRRIGAHAHVDHHRGPAAVRAPAAAALHGAPHARALSKRWRRPTRSA